MEEMMPKKRIGFIGLGKMGLPMSKNVLKGGFPLTVFDLESEPVRELVKLGGVSASSPKEVGQNSEIIIFMVPDSPHIEAAVSGERGLLEGMQKGNILIVMSTVEPLYIQQLAKKCDPKGIKVIDCPVSGNRLKGAVDGTLTIMAGGPKDVLEECREVLGTMGSNIIHCGEILGSGEMVKVANNLVNLSTNLLLNEAMVLGVKFGIKADTMFEVFKNSSASSWTLNNVWGPKVLKGDFTAVFDLDLAVKDTGLALASGKALKVPLILGSVVNQRYQMESAAGRGKLDPVSAIISLEELAGVQVRSEKK
jgi:3-hydroxyisobutyrate dehydrogenase-like beta-hydroxyacid dehydrogenase